MGKLKCKMKLVASVVAGLVGFVLLIGLCKECDSIYGSVVSFVTVTVLGLWCKSLTGRANRHALNRE